MLIKMREMMKNRRGFTLIELIVVMAILALLLAIAIPRFGNVMSSSKDKAHKANIEMLERAGELYYAENQVSSDVTFNKSNYNTNGFEKYVKKWPDNPKGTGDYTVTIKANGDIIVSPQN